MPRPLVCTTAHVGEDWAAALEPPDDPAWRLEAPGYQPALEHEIETRLAISNGLLGVRGALEQPASASRPRTYIAGLFDTPPGDPAIPALFRGRIGCGYACWSTACRSHSRPGRPWHVRAPWTSSVAR